MPAKISAPPVQRRRRGESLERALLEATLAELRAVGYSALTMEGVAARARTGKAALYRRWPSKHDLVQDALLQAIPPVPEPRTDRSTRDNLLAQLIAHRDVLAGKASFPALVIVGEVFQQPELRSIFAEAVMWPRYAVIDSILQNAVRNGEIEARAITPLTTRVGPGLINQHFQLFGKAPNRQYLVDIVNTVLPR